MSDTSIARSSALFPQATAGLRGTLRVPGDKSVSHRAALFGAVNNGPVRVSGFLRSSDTMASLLAIQALGVEVQWQGDELLIHGQGWEGLREPADVIDVANAGTLMRLLPGLVAPTSMLCVLTGDASIRRRPMARILAPLAAMGAQVAGRSGNTLPPIVIRGGRLRGTTHRLPVASAQVKSCLLLAGLRAEGRTTVVEPAASRDHTERLIEFTGGRIEREMLPDGGRALTVTPVDALHMTELPVPGDFSSAAFFVVAALLVPGSHLTIENVGLNPSRTGLLEVLARMGAEIDVRLTDMLGPEPIGTITVRSSLLSAADVAPDEVPNIIDELPLYLLAAARAEGISRLRGAAELRAKESDRLEVMASFLSGLGVTLTEYPDGIAIQGRDAWAGGSMVARGDHRMAMTGAIAGLVSANGVQVDDTECIDVSFPGFTELLRSVGGDLYGGVRVMIIALDGPAGSGKSTIAREVAKCLGFRYLDSGAMYRAITLLALEAGLVPTRIAEAGPLAAAVTIRLEERSDDLSRVFIDGREITDEIRGPLVTTHVSAVSADPGVRAVLTETQRQEAAGGNVVLEGRDIGTVVCPQADLKIYLTASVEERARRRREQLAAKGAHQSLEDLMADIARRDAYDSGRALAPLRRADDAVEIDTTGMSIEEVVAAVCAEAAARSTSSREPPAGGETCARV